MSVASLDWQDKALCSQVGGDVFFLEQGEHMEAAKAVCRSCEVRADCLAWSIEIAEWDGIYGGFTERVRRRIACRTRGGESLEDIIAADDAAFYARLESAAERAEAMAERKRVQERAKYAAARARLNELERAS